MQKYQAHTKNKAKITLMGSLKTAERSAQQWWGRGLGGRELRRNTEICIWTKTGTSHFDEKPEHFEVYAQRQQPSLLKATWKGQQIKKPPKLQVRKTCLASQKSHFSKARGQEELVKGLKNVSFQTNSWDTDLSIRKLKRRCPGFPGQDQQRPKHCSHPMGAMGTEASKCCSGSADISVGISTGERHITSFLAKPCFESGFEYPLNIKRIFNILRPKGKKKVGESPEVMMISPSNMQFIFLPQLGVNLYPQA